MQTEFPSTTIHFGYAFTFCRLRVYKSEEEFARAILKGVDGVEFLKGTESQDWQDIDTRLLLGIIRSNLPRVAVPEWLRRSW